MTYRHVLTRYAAAGAALAVLMTAASAASALDAYQDRRGIYAGVGLGGGAAFQDGEPGGGVLLDLQIGGGATKRITLALDVDFWFQLMDRHDNWMITPGPEVTFFITDGLFVRAGVGMALTIIRAGDDDEISAGAHTAPVQTGGEKTWENDFTIGFDGALAVGWEFFANSNLAIGLALEGDYVSLIDHPDVIVASFGLSLKHY